MTSKNKRVILITGASSGIGKACYDYLLSKGHTVYGTSRQVSESDPKMLKMDVVEPSTINVAVQHIIDREGRLEVVINNAGISVLGAAEETTAEDARRQLETNFWGAVHVINAALPCMRNQKMGYIINMSSLAGLFALPFQAFYAASKHALEGYTESLRMEVRPFGIHVSLIEPGDFKTEITNHREYSGPAALGMGDYNSRYKKVKSVVMQGERKGADVTRIAKLAHRIINQANPGLRYPIGKSMDLLAAKIKNIMPQPLFEWLIRDHYKIN
ncbi:MAG: SDR family oxidoreductase [Reichenbachiella sp.]|uniref:SDR family oxidoreductase n=1 Tax=Reichenbachiella sp. TaxID=2184521 RepID=UPI003262DB31